MNTLCDNCMHEFNIMAWGSFGVFHVETKRGLVSADRARIFGVMKEEYDTKVVAHPIS